MHSAITRDRSSTPCVMSSDHSGKVLRGAIMKAALQDALRMCPDFIDHQKKVEIVNGYKRLLSYASALKDPMRKTYQPNYIPIEEERIAKAVDLCAGHAQAPYAETAVVTEGASQSDEMGQEEDYLNIDAQDAGNFYRSG